LPDIHVPQFTVSPVAAAADLPAETIRQWYKRGILTIGKFDAEAEDVGLARYFSGSTAIAIGIMGHLTRFGVSPTIAARASIEFAHTGDGDRNPGYLFPTGQTLMMIFGDGKSAILNIDSDTKLSDVLPNGGPATLIELDEIVDRIRVKLGLGRDPRTGDA
jgi:hypothetical protein